MKDRRSNFVRIKNIKTKNFLASIPDRVIPKAQKMVLDTSLLNTQYYKALIKGKMEQSRERSIYYIYIYIYIYI